MPIYEFRCEKCGTKFEKLMSASNGGMPECPGCGGAYVKKLFSVFGFSSGSKTSFGDGCGSCSSSDCSTCGK